MAVTLEVYLDHQIIRGDLRVDEGQRPIDLLNGARDSVVELSDAWSASLHAEAPPARLNLVRLRRPHMLLAIPRTPIPLPPRIIRTGFVEKRPLHVEVGLGPFSVQGICYITGHEAVPLTGLENDGSGRFFVPFTDVCIKSQYSPHWKVESELIFVNRGAIAYSFVLPAR